QFKLWNKYTFTTGFLKNVSLGAGILYVDATTGQYTQYLFQQQNPAYTIFDLMVSYATKVGDLHATAWVSVQNAGNHLYLQGLVGEWAPPRKIFGNIKIEF